MWRLEQTLQCALADAGFRSGDESLVLNSVELLGGTWGDPADELLEQAVAGGGLVGERAAFVANIRKWKRAFATTVVCAATLQILTRFKA